MGLWARGGGSEDRKRQRQRRGSSRPLRCTCPESGLYRDIRSRRGGNRMSKRLIQMALANEYFMGEMCLVQSKYTGMPVQGATLV